MQDARWEVDSLVGLLRRRADHPSVLEVTGRQPSRIKRSAYYGFVDLKPKGISIVFKEASWVLPAAEIEHPSDLHVCAFHLHRAAHEGFKQYAGQLPGDVSFGDNKEQVTRKLGLPVATGGGGALKGFNLPIPHWLRYSHGGAIAQFQLDGEGLVEMFTLSPPGLEGSSQ